MILQVASRIKNKTAIWHIDSADLSSENHVEEARSMAFSEIEQQTRSQPGMILVGIQGGKQ